MINAAHEALHEYRMNLVFVIYPSSGNDANQQSFRVISFLNMKIVENSFWKLGISELFE